jgi:hypothetical protein
MVAGDLVGAVVGVDSVEAVGAAVLGIEPIDGVTDATTAGLPAD